MITKPDGIVAKKGKKYSPNLDQVVEESKDSLLPFDRFDPVEAEKKADKFLEDRLKEIK